MSEREPQTLPVDIGSEEFKQWALAQRRPTMSAAAKLRPTIVVPSPARDVEIEDREGEVSE